MMMAMSFGFRSSFFNSDLILDSTHFTSSSSLGAGTKWMGFSGGVPGVV